MLPRSLAVAVMATIVVSFARLLREICEQLPMAVPPCTVSVNTDGKYVACIDLHISRNDSIVELIRCSSNPASTSTVAEEEASRNAVKRLTQELDLHIRDANYDDAFFYKNMNDHLTVNLSNLTNLYNKLVWDYNFLKDCYTTTATEKNQLVADRLKIQQAIEECSAVLTGQPSSLGEPSVPTSDPSLPA